MKNDATAAAPEMAPMERYRPARAPSVHADATTPLRQAVISGLLVASSVTLIAALVRLRAGTLAGDGVWFLLALWAGTGLLVMTVAWFRQLGAAERTIWTIERVMGTDLDGDGATGNPVRWLPINKQDAPAAPVVDAPTQTWQAFERFIELAYREQRTDIRTARAAGFQDAQWKLFMDALEAAGLVVRTRRGENAPRRLVAPNAHACVLAMRKRGTFIGGAGWSSSVSSGVSSSSSS